MDGSATTFNNYCVRRRITERRIDDRVVYWWEYLNFRAAYGPDYNLISENWELPDIVEEPLADGCSFNYQASFCA